MLRYFITFSYDGLAYHGWQIQPNACTVQEVLQKALSTLLRRPVSVVGAGRTDAMVHARKMVAHFDVPEESDTSFPLTDVKVLPAELPQMVYRLNKMLPGDIAVQDLRLVPSDCHARFSATERTYHYYVHLNKDPFLRQQSWQLYDKPDFQLMNQAARILMEYTDFTSFSKTHTDTLTNECDLREAYWEQLDEFRWRFVIKANRFLRNMVRAVVGTLMEVGRGRMSLDELRRVVEACDRCAAGESVPAYGLYLVDVRYGDEGGEGV